MAIAFLLLAATLALSGLFLGGDDADPGPDPDPDYGTPTEGDDVLYGTDGNDDIDGLAGNDTILGGYGQDTLNGSGGDDEITGQGVLNGGGGADTIIAEDTSTVSGGGGRDTIWLYAFGNEVDAGAGNDTVHSAEGEDTIHGGAGNDELYTGYNRASELFGDEGDDILISSGINSGNTLHGGDGDDQFTVSGSDIVFGDAGNDTIRIGRLLDDSSPARVRADGGDGEDVFVSNGGDTLTGGADADLFELDVLHEGPDGPDYIASTITDYTTGEDRIVIQWDDSPLPEVTTAFNDDGSALQILLDGEVVAELTGVTSFDPDTLVFERA